MIIRTAEATEHPEILAIHQKAFGGDKGYEIKELVNAMLTECAGDTSFSFVAIKDDRIIGHVLFTHAALTGKSEGQPAQILAPLAVLPDYQQGGTGTVLVRTALQELRSAGIGLVFVLGHPQYYPRFGFSPAGKFGYEAPYSIPKEHSDAWMVKELYSGASRGGGLVRCLKSLDHPEHWRE